MSITQFGTNSTSTVKLWSQRTLYDFVSDTQMLGQMMKSGVLRREDQTSKTAGDRVTISFLERLEGQGLLGMEAATNQEDSLTYFTDNLNIDQLRYVVNNPAPYTIDQQRVLYDLPEDTYRVESEWMQVRGILGAFNQLAGNTATTITYDGQNYTGANRLKVTGLNAAVAPSTGSATRIIRQNGQTTDQGVGGDTTCTAKLTDILQMETIAATSRPYIRPLSETSEIKFHYFVHTQCYQDLMTDASSSLQYRDIQQALITSGRGEGEMQRSFVFSQTRVFNSDKIPQGVDSGTSAAVANTRRNVFCGRDAGAIAFGKGYTDGRESVAGFRIVSDFWDVGQVQRVAIAGIFGIKKVVFNTSSNGAANDNGVIVSTNYSSI